MSWFSKNKSPIFTALSVWLLYALLAGGQEAYHEVVCEGGFSTGEAFLFALLMGLMISFWSSPFIIGHFLLFACIRPLHSPVRSVTFVLCTFVICLLSFPVLPGVIHYDADIGYNLIRDITSHYWLANKFISAALVPMIVLGLLKLKRKSPGSA